jgi:hypothetical protein
VVIQYIFAYVCLIFKTAGNKNLLRVLSRDGSKYKQCCGTGTGTGTETGTGTGTETGTGTGTGSF